MSFDPLGLHGSLAALSVDKAEFNWRLQISEYFLLYSGTLVLLWASEGLSAAEVMLWQQS